MTYLKHSNPVARLSVAALVVICLLPLGCKKADPGSGRGSAAALTIQNIGSDTMVNLAQAWAEEYAHVEPSVSVEVSGGGSGIGIAALLNGTADIANASRRLEAEEIEKAKKVGEDPKEFVVGYDAISVFVHPSNPLNEISVEELGEIYREGGRITTWGDLEVTSPHLANNKIIRVSRQNNSGTYHYFRESVVGKTHDFRSGSLDMNGSKDVVELIAGTPGAVGYSGMGYATPAVKVLKIARKRGQTAVAPSIAATLDKTYPLARPMFMYTPGEPPPHIRKYLEWVLSSAGQKIVQATGYVPLEHK